ncbi:hypothetical protein LTS10_000918 [Elasticomyces elasticus]|nr:hypothetical protein LTS10_000918 [Elasticomyces elasticus]
MGGLKQYEALKKLRIVVNPKSGRKTPLLSTKRAVIKEQMQLNWMPDGVEVEWEIDTWPSHNCGGVERLI